MTDTQFRNTNQLKRYLKHLQIQQTQDLKLLSSYERKKIPRDASFVINKLNETRYRNDRIANLKARLRSSDK
jgi:hypothetical protein